MHPTTKLTLLLLVVGAAACGNNVPGTPLTREQLLDPQTCATCHEDHFNDWAQSMHAYAAEDPVFIAMNQRAQRETGGALGNFCVKCHAPMAVREGATVDGLNLASVDPKLKGVTCYFCHNATEVQGTHNDPLVLANDTTMRGEYSDPVQNQAHKSVYSNMHDRSQSKSASLCGTCHDIVAPPGDAVERTFSEWQSSVFGTNANGETCGECHMPQSTQPKLIAQAPGVKPREYHGHTFPAVDVPLTTFPNQAAFQSSVQDFMNTSLQQALCVKTINGTAAIRVILDNVAAGHNWPSGAAQDRRAWAEIIAYKDNAVIYQTGVVADGNDVTQLGDPNLWLMHDCIFDANGTQISMFWDAASHESNTLPALATFDVNDPRYYQTHIVQNFPRNISQTLSQVPDKVTMRIRIMPIGLDILNSLVASGDLDAGVLSKMPTFDVSPNDTLLTWTAADAASNVYQENGVSVQCVTNGLNVATDKTPAVNHSLCPQ